MGKRGQITIFILIGIIALISAAIYFILINISNSNSEDTIASNRPDINNIREFYQTCLYQQTDSLTKYVLKRGGYVSKTNSIKFLNYSDVMIPYYIHDGIKFVENPIFELKKSMEKILSENLNYCQNKTKISFPNNQIIFEKLEDIDISISRDFIIFKLQIPIKIINQKDESITITKISFKKKSSMFSLSNLASDIIKTQTSSQNYILLSELVDLANKNGMQIQLYETDNNSYIYTILDNLTISNPYKIESMNFVIGYNWSGIKYSTKSIESSFIKLKAKAGYLFTHTINKGNVEYYDDTYLFDIDKNTGKIEFIPKLTDGGIHYISITTIDQSGNSDNVDIILNISNGAYNPELENIGSLNAKIGQEFFYQARAKDAENNMILFFDDTKLFNINMYTGVIKFTPNSSSKGIHTPSITALNSYGLSDKKEMLITIDD